MGGGRGINGKSFRVLTDGLLSGACYKREGVYPGFYDMHNVFWETMYT